jgi:hypothetical protein
VSYPRVGFQVRIRQAAPLGAIAARVEGVLNCAFQPSEARLFAGDPALESTTLGLWISLRFLPPSSDGGTRACVLMGTLADELDARWPSDAPRIDISQYVLGLLHTNDSPDWYVPGLEEIYMEAGLAWPPDKE